MFRFIEGLYQKETPNYQIDDGTFDAQGPLKGYEVKMSLILYPGFIKKFENLIINAPYSSAVRELQSLFSDSKLRRVCRGKQNCVPIQFKRVLRLRRYSYPDAKALIKRNNHMALLLLEGFERDKVIKWIGSENYFGLTRVTGFLENTEKGYIQYLSDSVGSYNQKLGTGVFDEISQVLKLNPYDLRAINFTPGF
jgi:hypothetical protein